MWSGIDRKSHIFSGEPLDYMKLPSDYFYGNPNSVAGPRVHYLMNAGWDDELTQTYYKYFSDDLGHYISTLENILRVQWFLKLHNIKYFFTTYAPNSFNSYRYHFLHEHPDVKYLFDQVDLDHFLPVQDMDDWNTRVAKYQFEVEHDNHPTSEMSKGFAERVIVPHLKSKGYID